MYVLAIKCRGENNICQWWSKNNLQDGNIFAQSKNRIFAILPDDDHKSRKDKRVGDRKGIKASTAGYVAPCHGTRCWNAGWTLGSVTQNNCRAGSLPPNGLTAQREKKGILLFCDGSRSDGKWHPPVSSWRELWTERKADEKKKKNNARTLWPNTLPVSEMLPDQRWFVIAHGRWHASVQCAP